MNLPYDLDHPSFLTGITTALAYGLLLFGIFLLFFVLPWLVFAVYG